MPIFPRRVLQGLLDRSRRFFTPDQLRNLLNRLNRSDVLAIYGEWELVIVDAFRSEWSISYEPNLGSKNRLDIVFAPPSGGEPFALEVTAVTQKSYVEANPVEEFSRAFQELAKAKGIPLGRLFFRVENADVLHRDKPRKRLALPAKEEMKARVMASVGPFFDAIKKSPSVSTSRQIRDSDLAVDVTYSPTSQGFSHSHPSFDILDKARSNVIRNALNDKDEQFRGSGWEGVAGIAICDAGFNFGRPRLAGRTLGLEDVVREFFRDKPHISFVIAVFFKYEPTKHNQLHTEIFLNPWARYPVSEELSNRLVAVMKRIPSAESSPANVLNRLERGETTGISFLGAGTTTSRSIKLSSRALLDLMAGVLDQKTFSKTYAFPNDAPFFLTMLFRGQTIESINMERQSDKDDDWITITFSGPDAAISKLK